MIRVLIADDHNLVRKGLKRILLDTEWIGTVEEARDSQEAIIKAGRKDFDVVLLDISFPGRSGIDTLKQLKLTKPKLPVLILSMHPEEQYAVRSIRAGASGYLTKESAPEELIEAIRAVAGGRRYITPAVAERLAAGVADQSEEVLHKSLSDREFQVMCLIASGKTVSEVAAALSLSVKTISTHRSRILKKMDMKSNAQLTHYAIKQGLVD